MLHDGLLLERSLLEQLATREPGACSRAYTGIWGAGAENHCRLRWSATLPTVLAADPASCEPRAEGNHNVKRTGSAAPIPVKTRRRTSKVQKSCNNSVQNSMNDLLTRWIIIP